MSCPEHKRYRALRRPRLACEACWKMWFANEVNRQDADRKKRKGMCSCGHSFDSSHGPYGCFVKVGSASCDDAYCSCGVQGPVGT